MSAIIRRRGLIGADEPILWLYKDGDECTDVTGGWRVNTTYTSNCGIIKQSNRLALYAKRWSDGGLQTVKSIDTRGYSNIHYEYSVANITEYGLIANIMSNGSIYRPSPASWSITGSAATNLNLTIANFSAGSIVGYWYITKIWLEK